MPAGVTGFRVEYVQKYLQMRPDLVDHEEFINEQMQAFDEREQKVRHPVCARA